MTDRCEPPEHLRGVDGPHWVETGPPHAAEMEMALWDSLTQKWLAFGDAVYMAPEAFAEDNGGARYLAPVAPNDLVRELVEALEGVVSGLAVDGVDLRVTNVVALHNAVSAAPELLHRAKEAGV
jgi:hypothetical protein